MKKINILLLALAGVVSFLFLKNCGKQAPTTPVVHPRMILGATPTEFDAVDTTQSTAVTGPGKFAPMLIHFPKHYNENTSKYPLLIFLHGLGEQGGPAIVLYNNQNSGGPAYFIRNGQWPSSFHNYTNNTDTSFIVITPWMTGSAGVSSSGSISAWMMNYIIEDMVSRFRVDTTRFYITGLSAGGQGVMDYIGNIADQADHGTIGGPIGIRHRIACAVPMSAEFSGSFAKPIADTVFKLKIGLLPVGSPPDTHGANTLNVGFYINQDSAGYVPTSMFNGASYNGITYAGGHCCWGGIYTPTFTFPYKGNTINIYNYMLSFSGAAPPATTTVNAGPDQSLNACSSSSSFSGSFTIAVGQSIVSKGWKQVSGNTAAVFSDTTSATSTVSALAAGIYKFRFRVKDNAGTEVFDTMQITVAAPVHPTVSAGSNQSITLPTNSTTLGATVTINDCSTVPTKNWTQSSGPNLATITGSSTLTPTVSNLIQGIYIFKLQTTTNFGLIDSSKVTVNVVTSSACAGIRRVITITSDLQGRFFQTPAWNPGDTIVIMNTGFRWAYFSADGVHGTASCPIVIINGGGQVRMQAGISMTNSTYVHVTGTGDPTNFYGFYISAEDIVNPVSRGNTLQFSARSAHCEIDHIDEYARTYCLWIKNEADCQDSINNWLLDGFDIHDIRAKNINQDGFYLGSTGPEGGRQVTCSAVQYFPVPSRVANIRIWNIILDSVGRSGIQMSGAATGSNEIFNCDIRRTGYELNPQQGSGIIIGGHSQVYVHDNKVRCTYQLSIWDLGSGLSRIENNDCDSSGHIYSPTTGADTTNPNYVPIGSDTRPTVQSWPNDSLSSSGLGPLLSRRTAPTPVTVIVRGNKVGVGTFLPIAGLQIDLFPSFNATQPIGTGNIVCSNIKQDGTTPASFRVNSNVTFSTNCSVIVPPTVSAGLDQTLVFPTSTTPLFGSAIGNGGAIITLVQWTQVSGPGIATIVSPTTQITNISNLNIGTYVFNLLGTDNNGNSSNDQVSVTVTATQFIIHHIPYRRITVER